MSFRGRWSRHAATAHGTAVVTIAARATESLAAVVVCLAFVGTMTNPAGATSPGARTGADPRGAPRTPPQGAPQSSPPPEVQAALAHYEANRPTEAAAALRAWCDAAPDEVGRWLDAARIAVSRRDFIGGTPFAERCRAMIPEHAEAWNLLGVCKLLGGAPVEAEDVFRDAVARFPNDAEMHFQLGMALSTNQRFLEAEASFDRAMALAPDHPAIPFWAAENHARLDRLDRAEALFRKALRVPQVNPDAGWKLAEVVARRGRDDEAETLFQRWSSAGPALAALRATFHYGVFLFERGRDEEALARFVRVTTDWPEHRVAWSYRARTEQRLGRKDDALASLRRHRSLQQKEDAEEEAMLLSLIENLRRPKDARD